MNRWSGPKPPRKLRRELKRQGGKHPDRGAVILNDDGSAYQIQANGEWHYLNGAQAEAARKWAEENGMTRDELAGMVGPRDSAGVGPRDSEAT